MQWSERDYTDMRKVTLWAGQSPNVALPLAVKARDAFEYALEKLLWQYFLDVGLDCTTHIACNGRGRRTPVPMMFSSPVRYKTFVFRDPVVVVSRVLVSSRRRLRRLAERTHV